MSLGSTSALWSTSDYNKMPVATTRRISTTTSTSQRFSSSSLADRTSYLTPTYSSYSSTSRFTTPTRSATVPSSYSRTSTLDFHDTPTSSIASRYLSRDRTLSESSTSSSLTRLRSTSSDSSSSSPSTSYKPLARYSSSSTSTTSVHLPGISSVPSRRYTNEVTGIEPPCSGLSVSELRRKYDVASGDDVFLMRGSSSSSSTSSTSAAAFTNHQDSSGKRGGEDAGEEGGETGKQVVNGEDCVDGSSSTSSSTNQLVNGDVVRVKESDLPTTTLRSSPSIANNKVAEKGGLNGLRNIGNTCFMNSVIQCLSNTKPLLEYLSSEDYLNDINTSISSMKGALIKAFASVIQELWAPGLEDRVVNTSAFKGQIQRFAPRFMGYSQQDAQEFLRYLLEGLHEDVNRVTIKPKPITADIDDSLSDNQKASEAWKRYLRMDDSKIADIFVGQLKSTLQCTSCGHCSVTFDPFWDLSLPVPSRTGSLRLQACLDAFTKEEILDGDEKPTCSKCKTRRKCTKSFSIQKFPKILVLHLKRFSPTERFRGKLSNMVEFPLTGLDMSAYAAARNVACNYNLYAVSNHSGTTYSGHYTAHCKHPYTGHWHEYNDSRVTSLPSKCIVSPEAYVLFYELTSQTSHL